MDVINSSHKICLSFFALYAFGNNVNDSFQYVNLVKFSAVIEDIRKVLCTQFPTCKTRPNFAIVPPK